MRLRHVLYTNRHGAGAQGFRILRVGEPSLSPADHAQAEAWLQSVSPVGVLGFATRTLRLEAGFQIGLALVSPYFGRDDSGREGRLHHLVLVELEEGRTRGNVLAAGLRQLAAFWEKNRAAATLEKYVDACTRWRQIEASRTDPQDAHRLDGPTLGLLNLLAQAQPPAQAELGPDLALQGLADALGFLPPRLRYGVNLALGVRAPGAVHLEPGSASPAPADAGWQELLPRLAAEDPAQLGRLLDDWQISSLKTFEASLAAALGAVRTSPKSEPQSDPVMAREKNMPPAPPGTELPASEQRLRRYVDARLDAVAEQLLREPGFYQRYKVEIWGMVILLATLLAPTLYTTAPPRLATTALPATTAPIAVVSGLAKPAEFWPTWVKEHPDLVKARLEELPANKTLPAGTLSDAQKNNAEKFQKQLPLVQNLDPRDLFFADLRLLLFEFVAKKELSALAVKVDGKIDLVLGDKEYPVAELTKVAQKLSVTVPVNVKDPDFQADLVMAHLEQP